jgi:hypothetical protein
MATTNNCRHKRGRQDDLGAQNVWSGRVGAGRPDPEARDREAAVAMAGADRGAEAAKTKTVRERPKTDDQGGEDEPRPPGTMIRRAGPEPLWQPASKGEADWPATCQRGGTTRWTSWKPAGTA